MRLRFTLRDLFWLTLVVALAIGWWADGSRTKRQMELNKTEISELRQKLFMAMPLNDFGSRRPQPLMWDGEPIIIESPKMKWPLDFGPVAPSSMLPSPDLSESTTPLHQR